MTAAEAVACIHADDLQQLIDVQTRASSCEEFLDHFRKYWRTVEGIETREDAQYWLDKMIAKWEALQKQEADLARELSGAMLEYRTRDSYRAVRRTDGSFRSAGGRR
jgi:hypothetical protein